VSHFGLGHFHSLSETATHRLSQEVFGHVSLQTLWARRAEALDSPRERVRCIRCRCPWTRLTTYGDDGDPNCAVYDCRVGVKPLGLHKPIRSRATRSWWRGNRSGFWCCHWSSGGWWARSRSRSSDWWGNRHCRRRRHYTSASTGHLLRVPALRLPSLPIAELWIPRLFGIPCLFRAFGLRIPRLFGTASLPRSPGLWIAKQLGIPWLHRTPDLRIPKPRVRLSRPRFWK